MQHLVSLNHCPECNATNPIHDSETGEVVCRECGLVITVEPAYNTGPETRSYDPQERRERTRTGAPLTFAVHDKGLSTSIDSRNIDHYGKKISVSLQNDMYRLRKLQRRNRVHYTKERNLSAALSYMYVLAEKAAVPKTVHEQAAKIYRKALDSGIIKGRTIRGVAAAALYFACRQSGLTRNPKEIAKQADVLLTDLTRNYRLLLDRLNAGRSPPPSRYTMHISKVAAALGIPGELQGQAIHLLELVKKAAVGKDPRSMAGAALYIVCHANGAGTTQKDLADKLGITEVTVRNRYKELIRFLAPALGSNAEEVFVCFHKECFGGEKHRFVDADIFGKILTYIKEAA